MKPFFLFLQTNLLYRFRLYLEDSLVVTDISIAVIRLVIIPRVKEI